MLASITKSKRSVRGVYQVGAPVTHGKDRIGPLEDCNGRTLELCGGCAKLIKPRPFTCNQGKASVFEPERLRNLHDGSEYVVDRAGRKAHHMRSSSASAVSLSIARSYCTDLAVRL